MAKELNKSPHNCVDSRNTINMKAKMTTCHDCGKETYDYSVLRRLLDLTNEWRFR